MPASASQPSHPHAAFIWLIRGTGVFIAVASVILGVFVLALIAFAAIRAHPLVFFAFLALLLLALGFYGIRRTRIGLVVLFAISGCYFFVCAFVAAARGEPLFSASFGWFGTPLLVLGSLALLWLLGFMFWIFAKKGYDMWRRLDRITVADFASVFALFAARVFHYVLPAHLPNAFNEHLGPHFRDPFSDKGARALWMWLALYIVYKFIKAYLFRILELNPTDTAQNPPPSGPDEAPDEPFVPFDPYDLSKNRPALPH